MQILPRGQNYSLFLSMWQRLLGAFVFTVLSSYGTDLLMSLRTPRKFLRQLPCGLQHGKKSQSAEQTLDPSSWELWAHSQRDLTEPGHDHTSMSVSPTHSCLECALVRQVASTDTTLVGPVKSSVCFLNFCFLI